MLEEVFPGERWADTFLVETVQPVMETDSNPSIRPMTYYVESPEAIDRLFDNVAYSKCEFSQVEMSFHAHNFVYLKLEPFSACSSTCLASKRGRKG